MQIKATSLLNEKELGIEFTDKPVTPWGGLLLVSGLFKELKMGDIFKRTIPIKVTSPNATDPVEIFLAFISGVLVGSKRFSQIERVRSDQGIKTLWGLKRFVSDATMTRFFRRFKAKDVTEMMTELTQWQMKNIDMKDEILDLDSSVFERYGRQEGALLGYNPKKPRRPSHHPLLAVLGEKPVVVHSWLRSGNTSSSRGAEAFLEETLALLPQKQIRDLRADAGFGVETFLKAVEEKELSYAIAARMTRGLQRHIAQMKSWQSIDDGVEVSETQFQAQGWSRERRVVLIRQRTRKNDFVRGKELFDDPSYVYQGILTNRHDAPEVIWRFYRKHADIENRIRELKWDYGIHGFCLKKFYATEAAFRLICFTYNMMALLQRKLGLKKHQTLGTLRARLLACGAIVGRAGKKTILRLSLHGQWRRQFQDYLMCVWPTEKSNCVAVETG